MANPRVAIILVDWKGSQDTISCLRSLLMLDYSSFDIIVCDNDPIGETSERIRSWSRGELEAVLDEHCPISIPETGPRPPTIFLDRAGGEAGAAPGAKLTVIRTGGNLGFAGGNNVGLRRALKLDYDYVWLLNNDTVVTTNALTALIRHMKSDPSLGLCGSVLAEYDKPEYLQGYAGAIDTRTFKGRHLGAFGKMADLQKIRDRDRPRSSEVLYPVGASMLASKAFIEIVGLLNEEYFLYYEEADWVLRAGSKFKIDVAFGSLVYHKGGASAGSTPEGHSVGSVSFLYRSRLLIAKQFAPRRLFLVGLYMIFEAARGLIKGRPVKTIAAWRALTGKVIIPNPV